MSTINYDEYEDANGFYNPKVSRKTERFSIQKQEIQSDDILDFFIQEEIIDTRGVLLKPGKEADVYRCLGKQPRINGDVAVKIYKDAAQRSFQSFTGYMENRLENSGMKRRDRMHVMGSPSGMLSLWVESEYAMLVKLHKAGVPVPEPYLSNFQAIAMEFIGGDKAAPRLQELSFGRCAGEKMLNRLLGIVGQMLDLNVIHGDLSPYNILVSGEQPVIIDFPQAVDPRFNSQSKYLLERDIANLLKFFSGKKVVDIEMEAQTISSTLWKDYIRHEG